jgi:hypothetical protein
MPSEQLHEPWRSFLRDIDTQLSGPTEIHCLGGFVVAEYCEQARPTSDVDIIQVRGASDVADLQRIGGKGSLLAKKHRVYIDIVTVADVPERYEERLAEGEGADQGPCAHNYYDYRPFFSRATEKHHGCPWSISGQHSANA